MPPSCSTGSDPGTGNAVSPADYKRLDRIVDLQQLQRGNPRRYPCLLQSVARDDSADRARWDILFAFPAETLSQYPGQEGDFFRELDGLPLAGVATGLPELPFTGGWFVYLSYELAAQVEPGLALPAADPRRPLARASRIPAALINDHHLGCCHVFDTSPDRRCLAAMLRDLQDSETAAAPLPVPGLGPLEEEAPQRYLDQVQRIRNYIRDGDVFQVNLSRRWSMQLQEEPGDDAAHWLYRQLCRHNPAPFAAHVILDDYHIISSSPERLLRRRGDWLDTRPIAGTRPRDRQQGIDEALSRELLAHPKERAEHIMLIDLERNDLGRVCEPGSVSVDELMVLESYAHVHHIVSNIRGRLRPGIGNGSALRAVFPGGTITGCPKVRCMEIIAELEQMPRGAYTGSAGFISDNGNMDFNILIRTLELHGRELWFRTGAGIVADSDPERELQETRAKALGLLRALGMNP